MMTIEHPYSGVLSILFTCILLRLMIIGKSQFWLKYNGIYRYYKRSGKETSETSMTAQIHDSCFFKDEEYSIAGVKGEGMFHPAQFGFFPEFMHTACWRGYVAKYAVKDKQLFLKDLEMRVLIKRTLQNRPHELFKIAGVEPASYEIFTKNPPFDFDIPLDEVNDEDSTDLSYENINYPVAYTGGLLIGGNFLWDYYVHMGFQDAYKYETVHELLFEGGRLTATFDHSEKMKTIREKLKNLEKKHEKGENIEQQQTSLLDWIDDCFSLDYTL